MAFFVLAPGAGIRRLTGRQKIQGNKYQKERLIRHTGPFLVIGFLSPPPDNANSFININR